MDKYYLVRVELPELKQSRERSGWAQLRSNWLRKLYCVRTRTSDSNSRARMSPARTHNA